MCRWGPTICSLWQIGTSFSICKFTALWTWSVWCWFKLDWWNKLNICVINYLPEVTPSKGWSKALFVCICWFGFLNFFWDFSVNISQCFTVFCDAVAPVKDLWRIWPLALLRHSREILPLCVRRGVEALKVTLKHVRNAPTCHFLDTAVKAGTWPGHC